MKAVLVFCEGYHDVVFAQRSLGAHGGCEWVGRPIRELPTPFGSDKVARKAFIAKRLEPHALEDLAIRDAAHPPLPCFESIVENAATRTMFFMVRAHGKTQTTPVLDLLRSLDDTIDQPPGTFEDHLAPMVERAWPDRYTGADRFLEEKRHDGDKVSSNEAERLKAIITVTGQFDHPGDPMSIIIGRTGIPPAQFEESPMSAELAEFLTRTP